MQYIFLKMTLMTGNDRYYFNQLFLYRKWFMWSLHCLITIFKQSCHCGYSRKSSNFQKFIGVYILFCGEGGGHQILVTPLILGDGNHISLDLLFHSREVWLELKIFMALDLEGLKAIELGKDKSRKGIPLSVIVVG